ncbi:MAG: response regulator [Endomicrobiales bacterium]
MSPMVLILEDERNIADLLRDRLDDEGYLVRVAHTAADAIVQLRNRNPDVITLDIQLPDSNGLKILKELKSNPETQKIPVVIISSCDEGPAAIALGAEEFIHKPVNFSKLFKVLNDIKAKHSVNAA